LPTSLRNFAVQEAFADGEVPADERQTMKSLMDILVCTLQKSIGSLDFWQNSDKQKRARSEIKTALSLTDISELKVNRERIAVQVMKLAKNRHDQLLGNNNKEDAS